MNLLFTCEHAGNNVPEALRPCFRGRSSELASHRGWDPGALDAARALAARFHAPLLFTEVSRLVADTNRSRHHRRVVADLGEPSRAVLFDLYWAPHRAAVDAAVAGALPCAHVAVHSFTPVLAGQTRNADVGLLYDPARSGELALALAWQKALATVDPTLRVRRNYPYRGRDDGLTTHLRKHHDSGDYVGLELELNQASIKRDPASLVDTVGRALEIAWADLWPRAESGPGR